MKLNQLRDFLAVARHGSLRAAARDLDIAQPSLTKSIQALEAELGAALFQRAARGAILTPVGSALLLRAEVVMQELRRAKEEIAQLNAGGEGEVAFGITTAPTLLFLSRAMRDYRLQFPQVRLRIVNGIFPIVMPELKDGRLDFAVGPEPDSKVSDEFIVETLFSNTRVPVCRRDHPLASATRLADLVDAHWLVTSTSQDPVAAFTAIFAASGLAAPAHYTLCEASFALVELLMHTDMICWLPRQWTEAPIMQPWLTAIPVEHEVQGPDICLIRRRNLPLTPAADYLATLMRRATGSYARGREAVLASGS